MQRPWTPSSRYAVPCSILLHPGNTCQVVLADLPSMTSPCSISTWHPAVLQAGVMSVLTELACADMHDETLAVMVLTDIWRKRPQALVCARPATTVPYLLQRQCACVKLSRLVWAFPAGGMLLSQEQYLQTSGCTLVMQALRNIKPASHMRDLAPQYGLLVALAASASPCLALCQQGSRAYAAARTALHSTAARDEYLRGLEAAVANPAACRAPQACEPGEPVARHCLALLGET